MTVASMLHLDIIREKMGTPVILLFNCYLYFSEPLQYYICHHAMKIEKKKAAIIGHELTSFAACFFLSYFGSRIWFGHQGDILATKTEGIYAENEDVTNYIIVPMFCYQVWNFFSCFMIDENRKFAVLLHHVATAILASFCLSPLCHYYITYFFGISEISSLPLCIITILDECPTFKMSHPLFSTLLERSFCLLFIVIRIFYFVYLMRYFWAEYYGFYKLHATQEVKLWVEMSTMFVISVVLTFFQFYFLGMIIKALLGGSSDKSESSSTLPKNDKLEDKSNSSKTKSN